MTQPSLLDPLAARDRAMAQVAQRAEEHSPSFSERAQAFVADYLRQWGPCSGEDLTTACKVVGIIPHDDRAFGPVYASLVRRGVIVKAGACRRMRGHGTGGGTIWSVRS